MFRDRHEAGVMLGRRVSAALDSIEGTADSGPVVLALPRGGVEIGAEVARELGAPLDVLIVRKLGAPWQPELALGALALVGDQVEVVRNDDTISALGVDDDYLEKEIEDQTAEATRRASLYRSAREAVPIRDRIVIVADDGIATGATVRAALQAIRRLEPRRLVLAVPVAPPDVADALAREADDFICLSSPPTFTSVGGSYRSFEQTTDQRVVDLLQESADHAERC